MAWALLGRLGVGALRLAFGGPVRAGATLLTVDQLALDGAGTDLIPGAPEVKGIFRMAADGLSGARDFLARNGIDTGTQNLLLAGVAGYAGLNMIGLGAIGDIGLVLGIMYAVDKYLFDGQGMEMVSKFIKEAPNYRAETLTP